MSIHLPQRAVLCSLACAILFSACAGPAKSGHPHIYRGGQYYDDAIHK